MKRRLLYAFAVCAIFLAPAFGQEVERAREPEGQQFIFRVVNFGILVAGLGFLIAKNAGPFFVSRSQKIQDDLIQGEKARKEAEARAAEVDRRLAHLEADIAALRSEAQVELQKDRDRILRQTEAEMAKVRRHSEQEIAAAGKAARAELKRYSAELAIGIAEQKVRARMNPDIQDELVGDFVSEIDDRLSKAQAN